MLQEGIAELFPGLAHFAEGVDNGILSIDSQADGNIAHRRMGPLAGWLKARRFFISLRAVSSGRGFR